MNRDIINIAIRSAAGVKRDNGESDEITTIEDSLAVLTGTGAPRDTQICDRETFLVKGVVVNVAHRTIVVATEFAGSDHLCR
jgi:predicted Mrr-cat superfamily restriction endonuclease